MNEIYAESISATETVRLPDENYEYVFTITDGGDNPRVHVPPRVMERFFIDCFEELRPRFSGLLERNNQYREDNPDLLRVLGSSNTCDVLRRILPEL